MASSLRRRGPDDEGLCCDEHVALGARRLNIVDPENGHRPVSNPSGTIQVVLNGAIYNFTALRAALQGLGHCFHTGSDSEVIVHAYEAWGPACVSRLDGMFAFAIWDRSHRTLMLARDRMGEKPLYYYAGPRTFVFGSDCAPCWSIPRCRAT